MKLFYWYSECLRDSDAYSAIGKTKKEVLEKIKGRDYYGPVEKKVIEYRNGFDLLELLTSEDGCRGIGETI
jgi:hypothetical protein